MLKDVAASSFNPLTDTLPNSVLDTGLATLADLATPGIYYLSATDTWTPLTLSGLTLNTSTHTLTATGGGGSGDMAKVTYDANDNGVIDLAALATLATNATNAVTAATANAVAWTGVTGKPVDPMGVDINGNGSAILTGTISSPYIVPAAATITEWRITGDVSGNLVVDIQKRTPPSTTFVSITGGAPPTLSSQIDASSSSLGAWTVNLAANDVVRYVTTGTPTVSKATVMLKLSK